MTINSVYLLRAVGHIKPVVALGDFVVEMRLVNPRQLLYSGIQPLHQPCMHTEFGIKLDMKEWHAIVKQSTRGYPRG